jgi:hypothetical protein
MAASVMDRAAQMFPRLTAEQVERIAKVGSRSQVRAGELLFDVGQQMSSRSSQASSPARSGSICVQLVHRVLEEL